MDPTITGALLGAGLTAGPAALTAWWAGHNSSQKNQLDAVADYLDTVEQAVSKWRTVAAEVPQGLLTLENIHLAANYHQQGVQALVHAHREVQATVFHGYTLLDLRLKQKKVRKRLPQVKTAIEDYGKRLDGLEHKLANPSEQVGPYGEPVDDEGNPIMDAFLPDVFAPFLVEVPCGGDMDTAHKQLLATARRKLV